MGRGKLTWAVISSVQGMSNWPLPDRTNKQWVECSLTWLQLEQSYINIYKAVDYHKICRNVVSLKPLLLCQIEMKFAPGSEVTRRELTDSMMASVSFPLEIWLKIPNLKSKKMKCERHHKLYSALTINKNMLSLPSTVERGFTIS